VREIKKLSVCALEYRVVLASPEEVSELRENEGWTDPSTNTIFIRSGLPRSRALDVFVHEWRHAFYEGSGIGNFLEDHFKGESFEKFEETLIRLEVPWFVRLFQDNGLVDLFDDFLPAEPSTERSTSSPSRKARKKARGRR